MKTVILSVLAFGLMAGTAIADPVEGVWQTKPDDNGNFGHIEMASCGANVCGTITKAYDGAGSPVSSANIGKKIVWDMTPKGDGTYSGGKIWAPDRDKTYKSKMALNGDTLKVEGCVIGICRGQVWARVQ